MIGAQKRFRFARRDYPGRKGLRNAIGLHQAFFNEGGDHSDGKIAERRKVKRGRTDIVGRAEGQGDPEPVPGPEDLDAGAGHRQKVEGLDGGNGQIGDPFLHAIKGAFGAIGGKDDGFVPLSVEAKQLLECGGTSAA